MTVHFLPPVLTPAIQVALRQVDVVLELGMPRGGMRSPLRPPQQSALITKAFSESDFAEVIMNRKLDDKQRADVKKRILQWSHNLVLKPEKDKRLKWR